MGSNKTNRTWKAALLCVFMLDCLTQATQLLRSFTPPVNAQMKDLAISRDGHLFASSFVSDRAVVYRLNCNLSIQEALWITEGISVVGLTSAPGKIMICTSDRKCTSYDASSLNHGSTTVFADVLASCSSVTLVSAKIRGGGNSFYLGSSKGTLNLIGRYGFVSRSSGKLLCVTTDSFTRNWFGGFVAGSFAYFVVLDVNVSPNSETAIRVLRVRDSSRVTSVSEIQLDCLDLAGRVNGYTRLAGASLVTYPINGPGSHETALLVGIVTPPLGGYSGMYGSRVCAFRLSQIDSMIDSVSSSSTCFSGPLPWRDTHGSHVSCSGRCNLSLPGATEAAPTLPAVSCPLSVPLTNTSFELDFVLSISPESLTLLFIASTNHMDASIVQAFHVVDGSANSTGTWFSSWELPERAVKLTWIRGQNFLYVTTNTSVIQVPIEQCSNLTDCLSCAANMNPLCGWCIGEQKCSRRSQCQDSTLATSWLRDDSTQCPTSAITVMRRDSNNFNYTSVIPANTISSGGIILKFIGTFPNTIRKAVFVITNGSTSECEQTSGTLNCIAPPLGPIDFIGPPVYLVAGVDYTIMMEGVPGPVGESLNIEVLPDPVFISIRDNDQAQIAGSVKPIRIDGYYITNVAVLFEIDVTVGGEACQVDSGATTDTTLTCQPPQFLSAQSSYSALVRVAVGKYLNYTPGNVTLLVSSRNSESPIAAAVGGGVAGLFLLLLALALVVTAVLVIHRRRSLHKANLTDGRMTNILVENEDFQTGFCSLEMADFMRQYRGTIIPSDQIKVLNAIGNGEFGVVYKAHIFNDKTDQHEVVALKTLKGLFSMRDLLSMMSEILKMQDFNHPHVMTLMGMSFDAANTPSMVMPFMANGSLLSYLKMNRPLLLIADTAEEDKLHASQKLLTTFCYQVVQGMEYLAAQKFVHRDLAARNCMIDADGVIKVGDFGLSEDVYISGYFRMDKESRGVKLPFKWLAPESIQDGVFNEKTDVWSFGVTCWEIFTVGSVPYPGLDPSELLPFISNGRRMEKPKNAACSETMYSLMLRCWDSDPEDRPPFAKIAIIVSKALQTMSDYLDLSMKVSTTQDSQNESHEPAMVTHKQNGHCSHSLRVSTEVTVGSEPETAIQTSVCEAYTQKPRSINHIPELDDIEAQEAMPIQGLLSPTPRYVEDVLSSGNLGNPSDMATMNCEYELVQ